MGTVADSVRSIIELSLRPFDALGPFWGLTLISLLSGAGMLWVVGKTTPQKRIERSRASMAAAIYEIRLFIDSPRRVFESQARLIIHSFAYVGYMLPALFVLAAPLALLYLHLEVRHGLDPVELNKPFVVSVDLADGVDGYQLSQADADGPVRVTAPPLFVEEEGRVYLRAQVDAAGSHLLTLDLAGKQVTKRIDAAPDLVQVHPQRSSGWLSWISFGDEPSVDPGDGVRAISVAHPARDQSWLGLPIPWWLYWLVLTMIAALALRRPMGVAL